MALQVVIVTTSGVSDEKVNFVTNLSFQLLYVLNYTVTGLIIGMHPANERHCYKVTASLIGWAQT